MGSSLLCRWVIVAMTAGMMEGAAWVGWLVGRTRKGALGLNIPYRGWTEGNGKPQKSTPPAVIPSAPWLALRTTYWCRDALWTCAWCGESCESGALGIQAECLGWEWGLERGPKPGEGVPAKHLYLSCPDNFITACRTRHLITIHIVSGPTWWDFPWLCLTYSQGWGRYTGNQQPRRELPT